MPTTINFPGTKEDVLARARELRARFFQSGKSPRDALQDILSEYGGVIEYCEEETSETLKARPGNFTIYLPQCTSSVRDNFTIAHELGHYFLHTDHFGDQEIVHTRQGSNEREWQANWFAAELMMPRDDFLETAKRYNNNPELVGAHFSVSSAAARVRMSVLGIN